MTEAGTLLAPSTAAALAEAGTQLSRADPLTGLFALAMMEATLAGVDLRTAAHHLAVMRTEVEQPASLFAIADTLTVIAADLPEQDALATVLIRLRDRWTAQAVCAWIERIGAMLRADAEAGRVAWHEAIAAAVATFRHDIAGAIARAPLPLPSGLDPAPATIAGWIALADGSRWREALPLFLHLGSAATEDEIVRARILTILAEIEAVIRTDAVAAERAVAAAEALAPDDWRCLFARARLLEDKAPEEAERALDLAAARAPQQAEIHSVRARLRLKLGDADGAAAIAAQAAGCPSWPSYGLLAQIETWGNPALFPRLGDQIPALADRAAALARTPADAYDALLRTADAYGANGVSEAALAWYARAEALDPQRIDAFVNRGHLHLALNDPAAAAADFERVVAIAPGAVDGYWGLAVIAEQAGDWPALVRQAAHSIDRAPDWRPGIVGRLRAQAETAIDYANADLAATRDFYDAVRALAGPAFEPTYRNLLGNLAFFQGNHTGAADEYRRAIAAAEAEPDARFHGNLALALEEIDAADPSTDVMLAEAIAQAERARALDPEERDYQDYLRRFEATRQFVTRYGPAARALLPDKSRLRILLEPALTLLVTDDDGAGGQRLSERFAGHIAALREAIGQEARFTLCGVTVTDAPERADTPGWWALEAGGAEVESGCVPADMDVEAFLALVEAAVRRHLPRFLGLEEGLAISARCEGIEPLGAAPLRLAAFTRNARALLAETGRIDPATDAPRLLAGIDRAPPIAERGGDLVAMERLDGRRAPDGPDIAAAFPLAQEQTHLRMGVIVPLIGVSTDPAMPPGAWQVGQLPDAMVPADDRDPPIDELLPALLTGFAGLLIAPDALRWQMQHVRQSAPDIVAWADAAMDEAGLLRRLRARVETGGSIRNLRQAIEDILLGE
ncbi:tetratricopeptide repeat protein [Sphingomonas profundi]|uniref:tetratricopeptide repeat protein n=1 Tax=Alterirhizorhabdus profundi TaxID=2681549 RepID=UPI0012E8608C|nr:hypothetical protein [Sphingomonas profundi]